MMGRMAEWMPCRLSILLVGLSNVAAWAESVASNNFSTGAITVFCTVVVPLLGGMIIYFLRDIWPKLADAIFAYRERQAKLEAESRERQAKLEALTLSGQMASLTEQLAEERKSRAATVELAEVQAKVAASNRELAERANEHVKALKSLIEDLTTKVDEGNAALAEARKRLEDANEKLHNTSSENQNIMLQAELIKRDMQVQIDKSLAELHLANGQLAQLRHQTGAISGKMDQGLIDTSQLAARNADRLDEVEKIIGSTSSDSIPVQPPPPTQSP